MVMYKTARDSGLDPLDLIRERFGDTCRGACDATWSDARRTAAIAVCGLAARVPVVREMLGRAELLAWLAANGGPDTSFLFCWDTRGESLVVWSASPQVRQHELPAELRIVLVKLLQASPGWAGRLNERGEHESDPRSPSPGPHFHSNLLLGCRIGHPRPLQTTPKSVVDRLGRGSFRSHAATQVLATRWDLRQEENGFPANRQFYLTEFDRLIFYSATPEAWMVREATTIHGVNWTSIRYRTVCDLEIERLIFIAPWEEGQPLACEIQQITIRNLGRCKRDLRLVYTGMFGPSKPPALMEDVLYSTIIMQAGLLENPDGSVLALSPDYQPLQDQEDRRFQTLVLHDGQGVHFPREFGTSYQEFIGNACLERPVGILRLGNSLHRKGPGFFALALPFSVEPEADVAIESFTGLVSRHSCPDVGPEAMEREIRNLLARYDSPQAVEAVRSSLSTAAVRHASFFQLTSGRPAMDATVNHNLPFQVYYQSFASRSFCQTQKGYREIGFREIQDLFASMYYFQAAGQADVVEDLICQWASQVHSFGFANHNFYWTGKEPGNWSDDALWLVQAVFRWVSLSGDGRILDRVLPCAGGQGQSRPLYRTLEAIIRYSGELSLGQHGLPLLDRADWNDCLKLDRDSLDGPTKERRYQQQVQEGLIKPGRALHSSYTESVMNAFLLKLAADQFAQLADSRHDDLTSQWATGIAQRMAANCQSQAWKGNWFARLLMNRPAPASWVGAAGDGLASDGQDGSYFLNSFSWSVLAACASESQIAAMFEIVETRLKTSHGYRLVSPIDLRRIDPLVASAEYFPGDRENGAVFKHASMMAAAALFEAAARVESTQLASRLAAAAWWMVDLALPCRTLEDPFVLAGNPRFCTQYNNSETGENIGPLLSGTATWLNLVLLRAYGIDCRADGWRLDPLLRPDDVKQEYTVRFGQAVYRVSCRKPRGFYRCKDREPQVKLDGRILDGTLIPLDRSPGERRLELGWE